MNRRVVLLGIALLAGDASSRACAPDADASHVDVPAQPDAGADSGSGPKLSGSGIASLTGAVSALTGIEVGTESISASGAVRSQDAPEPTGEGAGSGPEPIPSGVQSSPAPAATNAGSATGSAPAPTAAVSETAAESAPSETDDGGIFQWPSWFPGFGGEEEGAEETGGSSSGENVRRSIPDGAIHADNYDGQVAELPLSGNNYKLERARDGESSRVKRGTYDDKRSDEAEGAVQTDTGSAGGDGGDDAWGDTGDLDILGLGEVVHWLLDALGLGGGDDATGNNRGDGGGSSVPPVARRRDAADADGLELPSMSDLGEAADSMAEAVSEEGQDAVDSAKDLVDQLVDAIKQAMGGSRKRDVASTGARRAVFKKILEEHCLDRGGGGGKGPGHSKRSSPEPVGRMSPGAASRSPTQASALIQRIVDCARDGPHGTKDRVDTSLECVEAPVVLQARQEPVVDNILCVAGNVLGCHGHGDGNGDGDDDDDDDDDRTPPGDGGNKPPTRSQRAKLEKILSRLDSTSPNPAARLVARQGGWGDGGNYLYRLVCIVFDIVGGCGWGGHGGGEGDRSPEQTGGNRSPEPTGGDAPHSPQPTPALHVRYASPARRQDGESMMELAKEALNVYNCFDSRLGSEPGSACDIAQLRETTKRVLDGLGVGGVGEGEGGGGSEQRMRLALQAARQFHRGGAFTSAIDRFLDDSKGCMEALADPDSASGASVSQDCDVTAWTASLRNMITELGNAIKADLPKLRKRALQTELPSDFGSEPVETGDAFGSVGPEEPTGSAVPRPSEPESTDAPGSGRGGDQGESGEEDGGDDESNSGHDEPCDDEDRWDDYDDSWDDDDDDDGDDDNEEGHDHDQGRGGDGGGRLTDSPRESEDATLIPQWPGSSRETGSEPSIPQVTGSPLETDSVPSASEVLEFSRIPDFTDAPAMTDSAAIPSSPQFSPLPVPSDFGEPASEISSDIFGFTIVEPPAQSDLPVSGIPAGSGAPTVPLFSDLPEFSDIPAVSDLPSSSDVTPPDAPTIPSFSDLPQFSSIPGPSDVVKLSDVLPTEMPSMPSFSDAPGVSELPNLSNVLPTDWPSVPSLSDLPGISNLPGGASELIPTGVPSIPSFSNLPEFSNIPGVSDLPSPPSFTEIPGPPELPNASNFPGISDVPGFSDLPGATAEPDIRQISESPVSGASDAPSGTAVPSFTPAPGLPNQSDLPGESNIPGMPDLPGPSDLPEIPGLSSGMEGGSEMWPEPTGLSRVPAPTGLGDFDTGITSILGSESGDATGVEATGDLGSNTGGVLEETGATSIGAETGVSEITRASESTLFTASETGATDIPTSGVLGTDTASGAFATGFASTSGAAEESGVEDEPGPEESGEVQEPGDGEEESGVADGEYGAEDTDAVEESGEDGGSGAEETGGADDEGDDSWWPWGGDESGAASQAPAATDTASAVSEESGASGVVMSATESASGAIDLTSAPLEFSATVSGEESGDATGASGVEATGLSNVMGATDTAASGVARVSDVSEIFDLPSATGSGMLDITGAPKTSAPEVTGESNWSTEMVSILPISLPGSGEEMTVQPMVQPPFPRVSHDPSFAMQASGETPSVQHRGVDEEALGPRDTGGRVSRRGAFGGLKCDCGHTYCARNIQENFGITLSELEQGFRSPRQRSKELRSDVNPHLEEVLLICVCGDEEEREEEGGDGGRGGFGEKSAAPSPTGPRRLGARDDGDCHLEILCACDDCVTEEGRPDMCEATCF